MGLASLLNVPETEQQFLRWGFSNADGHLRIITAIRAQKGVSLVVYPLDPVPTFDRQNWFRRHQTAHNDFTSVLGIQGSDLVEVDWTNEEDRQSWIRLHAEEHIQANNILRI